jgi:hypothetical protein
MTTLQTGHHSARQEVKDAVTAAAAVIAATSRQMGRSPNHFTAFERTTRPRRRDSMSKLSRSTEEVPNPWPVDYRPSQPILTTFARS